ncbi:MAG TPA: MotA/TolQ/ExbB proton channel family protein [Firmicutes bacterium]|uniref:MotA/TolQ/ExbB proton channel domain-containing protein n=1 Tax=candidate division TA06 bacterium TaxID=2250710 RepID=A0A660SCZ1_UNCT6|nr:MAG: hypothetical protein DRP44_01235 [candidate division TA06 bacterium]HFD04578.1 MotA/TolQ/ExbB proton channel family protein [Bacillota bacterium]
MIGGVDVLKLITSSWIVDFILFITIYAIAMIIERWWTLSRAHGKDDKFIQRVINLLNEGNLEQAKYVCEQEGSPVAKIMHAGVSNFDAVPESVQNILDNAIESEERNLIKGVRAIGVMSYIAPLLGLLGSLIGIISVFHGASLSVPGSEQLVMGGIAEALVSTVLGVTISIICAVAYSAFDDKVKDIVGDLKSSATYYISYIKGEVNIV